MKISISDDKIFRLVGSAYENARCGDAGSWAELYKEIGQVVGSGPGGLTIRHDESGKFDIVASTLERSDLRKYTEHYRFVDPLMNGIRGLKPCERFSRRAFLPDNEFHRTKIYQDYFRPLNIYEIEYYSIGEASGIAGGICFSRPKSDPEISQQGRNAINVLLPHLDRAFHLYLMLKSVQSERQQMIETLNVIPQSVLIVDRASKIVFMNRSAKDVLNQKDGLSVHHGKLTASIARDNTRIREEMSRIASIFEKNIESRPAVVQISRPSGKRPLQLLLSPLNCPAERLYSRSLALIFVFDPEEKTVTGEDVLMSIYSLTGAEARLAALIAGGQSIREASETLDVRESTVKTHLKHIFSKTDTRRQSELMNLILHGPANLKSRRDEG